MKKIMILLAAMAMSTLMVQANEEPATEITVSSMDAAPVEAGQPTEDDKNTTEEETPKS